MLMFRPINDGIALWHIKMSAWLIQQYGIPLTPPIPRPHNYQVPLHQRCWDNSDSRLPLQWAQDEFALICNHMHMGSLDISLIPDPNKGINETAYLENRRLTAGWQTHLKTRIKLDINGNPIVTYNPSQCNRPGYLSAVVIMDLAKIYIGSKTPPADFDPFFELPLTLLGAAHLGQGLTIAAMPFDIVESVMIGRNISKKEYKEFLNVITFVSVLHMACRRLSPEQIISSFGKVMTPQIRKRIWPIYRGLKHFEDELETLRGMSGAVSGTSVSPKKVFTTQRVSHSLRA